MKEFYSEVKCDYNNNEGFWCVDAWRTGSGDEEGKVVAVINDTTGDVFYCEPEARLSPMVSEVVKQMAGPIKGKYGKKRHPGKKGKPFVIDAIFGESACEVYGEKGLNAAKRWISRGGEGAAGTYRFETEADRETAAQMLANSDGWLDAAWEFRETKK